jgi:hypothetical protein
MIFSVRADNRQWNSDNRIFPVGDRVTCFDRSLDLHPSHHPSPPTHISVFFVQVQMDSSKFIQASSKSRLRPQKTGLAPNRRPTATLFSNQQRSLSTNHTAWPHDRSKKSDPTTTTTTTMTGKERKLTDSGSRLWNFLFLTPYPVHQTATSFSFHTTVGR